MNYNDDTFLSMVEKEKNRSSELPDIKPTDFNKDDLMNLLERIKFYSDEPITSKKNPTNLFFYGNFTKNEVSTDLIDGLFFSKDYIDALINNNLSTLSILCEDVLEKNLYDALCLVLKDINKLHDQRFIPDFELSDDKIKKKKEFQFVIVKTGMVLNKLKKLMEKKNQ